MAAPPADLLETPPSKPELKVLTYGDADSSGVSSLRVPESLTEKWTFHASFGDEFRKILDGIYEEFGQQAADEGAKLSITCYCLGIRGNETVNIVHQNKVMRTCRFPNRILADRFMHDSVSTEFSVCFLLPPFCFGLRFLLCFLPLVSTALVTLFVASYIFVTCKVESANR